MRFFVGALSSSIGKKLLMALTGLSFIGFLLAHLAGNFTIFSGPEAFNDYMVKLQSLGVLLKIFELGLISLAVIHVSAGLVLYYQNWKARPNRYAVDRSGGGRTIGSATMPYTGVLILIFVVIHLVDFTFADKSGTTLFALVSGAFQNPAYVIFYTLAMVIVAIHVSHGFWSAFQTLGANHPKYMPMIMTAGVALAILLGLGFGFLPVYFSMMA